jgi:hypothetical protein
MFEVRQSRRPMYQNLFPLLIELYCTRYLFTREAFPVRIGGGSEINLQES